MPSAGLAAIVARLDALLEVPATPDYPSALNGLQFANSGVVTHIAAAVDFSGSTIEAAARARANMLIVHHGMFWGGLQRIDGPLYLRVRSLVQHDIAVYAAHLPLDRHPELGNNALLARALLLEPSSGFGRFQAIDVGVAGESDLLTIELLGRATAFAAEHGGSVRATPITDKRRTRRWAIVTGAGASSDSLREAATQGIDTLIVGEGPHHTAVEAAELGLVVIYAGHYATETLGVQALARKASSEFGIPWTFLPSPTGL
jgi:dinuclear metal center YbgI/SA1388 family protein